MRKSAPSATSLAYFHLYEFENRLSVDLRFSSLATGPAAAKGRIAFWIGAGRLMRAPAMPRLIALVLAAVVVLAIVALMIYSNP